MNASSRIHLTPAKVKGKYVIRFVACQEGVNEELIDSAWKTILEFADEIINELSPLKKRPRSSGRKLDRTHSQRFSFTRNVSQELYERQPSMYVDVFGHLLICRSLTTFMALQTKAHGWRNADCRHRHRRHPGEPTACDDQEQGSGSRCCSIQYAAAYYGYQNNRQIVVGDKMSHEWISVKLRLSAVKLSVVSRSISMFPN